MIRYYAVIAMFVLAGTADSASRIRLEEGARARQSRIASTWDTACAVLDDGTVHCWGNNTYGEVGDGTTISPKKVPVQVSGLNNIVSIAAGGGHTCVLDGFGLVRCWGLNNAGQLGDGSLNNSSVPVAVSGLDKVVAIAAGVSFTCAIRTVATSSGNVWCWGDNFFGEVGPAHSDPHLTPVQPNLRTGVDTGDTVTAIAIATGANHACARLSHLRSHFRR